MRRWGVWWTAGALAPVALILSALVFWFSYWSTKVWTDPTPTAEEAVRRRMEAALPLGSTREEVKTWLASERMAVSEIAEPGQPATGLQAGKRLPSDNWLGFYDFLEMEFHFNNDGLLTGETARIAHVGS